MTELVCASGVELLMDYLEGELPADLRAAVEAHVAGCPRCVAFLGSYRATPDIMRRATAASLPAELGTALMDAVRGRSGGGPKPTP